MRNSIVLWLGLAAAACDLALAQSSPGFTIDLTAQAPCLDGSVLVRARRDGSTGKVEVAMQRDFAFGRRRLSRATLSSDGAKAIAAMLPPLEATPAGAYRPRLDRAPGGSQVLIHGAKRIRIDGTAATPLPASVESIVEELWRQGEAVEGRIDPVVRQAQAFRAFDLDRDGRVEIENLVVAGSRRALDVGGADRALLVLVAGEILRPLAGAPELIGPLEALLQDFADEGVSTHLVLAHLDRGPVHQDGRTLLALRRFLAAVRRDVPSLEGVLLIGRFPEAMIVRQHPWRKRGTVNVQGRTHVDAAYLRWLPEVVATKADLVLGDLDGNWEAVYRQAPTEVPGFRGIWPAESQPADGYYTAFEATRETFEDFFLLQEAIVSWTPTGDGANVTIDDATRDAELAASDRAAPNPIARPEIYVGRLDASGIARSPDPAVVDLEGRRAVEDGRPQELVFGGAAPTSTSLWVPDPKHERALLAQYFDRQHRWRRHAYAENPWGSDPAFVPSCLTSADFDPPVTRAKAASPRWSDVPGDGPVQVFADADLLDAVDFLAGPSVYRVITTHTDESVAYVGPTRVEDLEARFPEGGWWWDSEYDAVGRVRLVPGLALQAPPGGSGRLDVFLLRSIWENDLLPDGASFYLHEGCNSITPSRHRSRPYHDPAYGLRNGAAALLFYGQGLALMGRAKVFNDHPVGFEESLHAGSTYGEAWATYFTRDAANRRLSEPPAFGATDYGIARKRSYTWSVLGDASLRLNGR